MYVYNYTRTSNAPVPAASPFGLFDDGGQSVSEVGEELVLQPHGQTQEPVQKPRQCC